MATADASKNKSFTPPKGRATRRRNARPPRVGLPASLQWLLVVIAAVTVAVGVFIWLDDTGGSAPTNQGGIINPG